MVEPVGWIVAIDDRRDGQVIADVGVDALGRDGHDRVSLFQAQSGAVREEVGHRRPAWADGLVKVVQTPLPLDPERVRDGQFGNRRPRTTFQEVAGLSDTLQAPTVQAHDHHGRAWRPAVNERGIDHYTRCYPRTSKVSEVITVLSGGVGAARLLRALRLATDPSLITAIVNVGDDFVLHGLTICPDLDTIGYTLAGLNNEVTGWGLADETWRVMEALEALGGDAWFRLGDHDLATHLYRSQRLREGATKSEVTNELAKRWQLDIRLLPVTDDAVATFFETEIGRLSFQEYFVRHRHGIAVRAITFDGAASARPAPGVIEALRSASRIVIAPSNPLISIDPILEVPGLREVLHDRRDDVVAVSPIINGAALKGPADRLLAELGYEVSCVGVADYYREVVGRLVIDEADAALADEVHARGVDVTVTTTIMANAENSARLAQAVLS